MNLDDTTLPTMPIAEAMTVVRNLIHDRAYASVTSSIEADAIRHRELDALTLALAALMTVRMSGTEAQS